MEIPTTNETTMRDAKGDDFVTQWAETTARIYKMHSDFVAQSINNVMGTSIPDGAFEGTPDPETLEIVGNLVPSEIKRIIPHFKGYAQKVREARRTECMFCGQDTGGNECSECS